MSQLITAKTDGEKGTAIGAGGAAYALPRPAFVVLLCLTNLAAVTGTMSKITGVNL
jgi:hypothetical protein